MIEKAGIRSTIRLRALIALGNPVAYENEVIQPSRSDLRVDGITQEDVYNDK